MPQSMSQRTPEELLAYDREHVWHPYTSMTDPVATRLVTGASGVHLELSDGRRVVDGMSSWWSAIHGYRHPALDAALRSQADEFAHVMFGGLTHAPAVRLAERLVSITPSGLDHVFFADSGSVSVEVALKMALQHQRGVGRPERTRMLTVRGGYHGDTFGAMSVCDPVGGMHTMFTGVLQQQVFADRPPASAADVPAWADGFRDLAAAHAHELAGIIVEPVLQGAGGMFVYDPACVRVMREVADEHGLVLVLDEIATGFGRTGTLFAAEAAGVVPRHHVRRQGADRRLPHAGRGALHERGRSRAERVGVRRAHARSDLHGQPAGLRGGAGQPRPARVPRLALVRRPHRGGPRGGARAVPPGSQASSTSGRSARSASSSSTVPSTSTRPPRPRSTRGSGCGRSATSSTPCPPTSAPTTTSRRICAAVEAAAVVG